MNFTMEQKRDLKGHPSDYGSRTLENEQTNETPSDKKTDEERRGNATDAQEITENGSNT